MRLAVMFWVLAACAAAAQDVRVVDGDTLEVGGVTYRIEGIDAPEFGQTCQSKAGLTTCGKDALIFLSELVKGADVQCVGDANDGYGRVIARCSANGGYDKRERRTPVCVPEVTVIGLHDRPACAETDKK